MSSTPSEMDDAELSRRILAGEAHLFAQIVERYQNRLFAALMTMVPTREDAEDLTQETLVQAFRKLGSFEGRSSLLTWMHRIAMNLAISHRRKHRLERQQSWTAMEVASSNLTSTEHEQGDTLEQGEERALLQSALARIDAEYREIIVLRDIHGYDYAEIADLLSLPAGTVRSRLHRARIELRDTILTLEQGKGGRGS